MYKVQKNRDLCLNRHNSSKIHLKSKEGWKIQHKFCMVLWPSKQGSFFLDTLYAQIELKLIYETDFRV